MAPSTSSPKTKDNKTPNKPLAPAKEALATESKPTPKAAQQAEDKYLRLRAEFENYKRRTNKDRLNWITNANQGIITTLLPILEDFERAIGAFDTTNPNHKELRKGIELIYDKLFKALQQQGLSSMQVAKGDTFDPDQHEALNQVPIEDKTLRGKIIEVVAQGYLLHEKTIRIAKVIIGA